MSNETLLICQVARKLLSVAMGLFLWPYVRPPSKDPQEGPPA